MSNVVKLFPWKGRLFYPAPKFLKAAEENDRAVWIVCDYIRIGEDTPCEQCPALVQEEHYGPCKKGCRGLAEEMIAVCHGAMATN